MKRIIIAIIALMLILRSAPAQTSTSAINSGKIRFNSSSDTKILVHYMPWYQTPSVSGYWGWHWTMDHFNPESLDFYGNREIASHFYPLTGPYDSKDDDILEYQVLLMKLSGIDGVIVDWYGIENFWDYGIINESTQALFDFIKIAQLFFSICYEDQTIGHMVNNGHLNSNEVYAHGKDVMLYLQEKWFNDNAYLKLSDKPVLLNFGPQYFHESLDWDTLFSVLDTLPLFFTLDNPLVPVATGAFSWPPMWASQNGVLTQQALNNYLSAFYQESASWDYHVTSAFPGFRDIYNEAELGFSYGYLDPLDGETFRNTLDIALNNNPDIIQIVTWNDYGEGTIIEPTLEFGYQYLEIIQDMRRDSLEPTFPFTIEDLEIPIQVYNLRKSNEDNEEVNQRLNYIFNLIIIGDLQSAVVIIDSLNSLVGIIEENMDIPSQYKMSNCYPNPFNPTTSIQFSLPSSAIVELSVYDILGRKVTTILDQHMDKGTHTAKWNAINQPSGVYFIRMSSGDFVQKEKVLLLR